MMYGVYAGAGTSIMILLIVVIKSCIDLCTAKPADWKDIPEDGEVSKYI